MWVVNIVGQIIIASSLTLVFCSDGLAQEAGGATDNNDRPLTVDEVRRLYPTILCDDFLDEDTLREWKQVVALGKRLIPAIIVILNESNDDFEIGRLLSIAREMQDDTSALLTTVRGLLNQNNKWIRIQAVWTLGDMGGLPEAPLLIKHLEEEDQGVRKVSAEALGKIGNSETADRMEAILEKRKAAMTPEEIRKDTSIAALEKAIADIKQRVSKKPEISKPEVKTDVDWFSPLAIAAVVVLAGAVIFLLLRRKGA